MEILSRTAARTPGFGRAPAPGDTVLSRLAEVVSDRPDALAVTSPGARISYAELALASLSLSASILARLAHPDHPADPAHPDHPADPDAGGGPVAVLADQGVATVVASFAIMAAGAPVVILDPLLPADRLRVLVDLAGAALILADEGADDLAREVAASCAGGVDVMALTIDTTAHGRPLVQAAHDAARELAGIDLPGGDLAPATVIFTSGSTGQPKGVLLAHRNVVAAAHISRERLHFGVDDRVALVLPHAFSAGQEVAFGALLNGASLHARDPRTHGLRDLPDWLDAQRITTLHGTPSLLRALVAVLRPGQVLRHVRLVTACGEVVLGRDVRAVRPHLPPGAVFTGWLGSSEGGQLAYLELTADAAVADGPLPAGGAPPLKELAILDDAGRPVATGEVGALTVTSSVLPQGYWRDPQRTAERFIRLDDGRVRLATGDRGWIGADGVLHLTGRVDDAVKIRGYLVEPADVETALMAIDGVAQAVVRGRRPVGDDQGPVQLIGWIVPDPRIGLRSQAALRRAARAALPEYMVPSSLVLVASLPLTERGKLDVARLPAPPPRAVPSPPTTDSQDRIGTIWASVLELSAVGPDESFSELGGDSLAVEEMLTRLREESGVTLALNDVAEHPTLAEFAAFAEGADRRRSPGRATGRRRPGRSRVDSGVPRLAPTTVRLRASGPGLPVFCFAGNAGHAAAFSPLASALGPEHSVHAFQVNGLSNRGLLDWTVAANAARHLKDLRRIAPSGPVVLIGHSLGGLFALEAARQLAAQGRSVPLVVLIDTFLPPRHGGHVGDWSSLDVTDSVVHQGSPLDLRPGEGEESHGDGPSPWRLLLRTLRRQEASVLRRRLMLVGAGPLRYSPATADAVMWQHGLWLGRTARVRPWAGRSLLFTSGENRDPIQSWEPILVGPHEVVRVIGDHAGLLKQPFLPQVLGPVARAIAEIQEASIAAGSDEQGAGAGSGAGHRPGSATAA